MSFSPLEFNQTVKLNHDQMAQHEIDLFGKSSLDCYSDSIFSVSFRYSKIRDPKTKQVKGQKLYWVVTRILNAPLPLDQPVTLASVKVKALQVREDGSSRNPDFHGYHFIQQEDGSWLITKFKKDEYKSNEDPLH